MSLKTTYLLDRMRSSFSVSDRCNPKKIKEVFTDDLRTIFCLQPIPKKEAGKKTALNCVCYFQFTVGIHYPKKTCWTTSTMPPNDMLPKLDILAGFLVEPLTLGYTFYGKNLAHLTFQIHHQAAAVWRKNDGGLGLPEGRLQQIPWEHTPDPHLFMVWKSLQKLVVWGTWDMLTRGLGWNFLRKIQNIPLSRVVNESIILPSFLGWCIENPPTGQEPRKTLSLYLMHREETSFRKHKIDTNSQRNVARVIEFC